MTEENLKGCIEHCIIDEKSFYIDSRFGTVIYDLHDYYKKGSTSFTAKPVKEVKNIIRIDTTFYVGLIVEESGVDVEVSIEVKYFEFDKSFIVRTHDPTKIIPAILRDPECAKYLASNGHPFYITGYLADYNKIPKYIESAWKMYDEKDDKNDDKNDGSDEEAPKLVSDTWYQEYIRRIHNTDEQIGPPKKKRPIKLIGQRKQEATINYEDDFNWNDIDDLERNRIRIHEPPSDECDSCAGEPDSEQDNDRDPNAEQDNDQEYELEEPEQEPEQGPEQEHQEESAFTVEDALDLLSASPNTDNLDALDALNLAGQYQEGKSPPRRLLKSTRNSELHSYVQTYGSNARSLLLNRYDEMRRLREFEELHKFSKERELNKEREFEELNKVLRESMLTAQQYDTEEITIPAIEKREDNLS